MKRLFLLLCCVLSLQVLSAQSLSVNGNIVLPDNSPEGAVIIIAKNGNTIDRQTINKKGRFDLKLAIGADYKITFEKAGYITKIVSVNTEVPEESLVSNPNFPPVKLIINLLPTVRGVDLSVFEQPIAILAYNPELDDFTFDKDYSNKIKSRIALAEQAIQRELTNRSAAAQELGRKFAALLTKGQQAFDRKNWSEAIAVWTQALELKPGNAEVEQKIAAARQEAELENARRSVELHNAQAYKMLLASADSLAAQKKYTEALEKYKAAIQLNSKDPYPVLKIHDLEALLAAQAKEQAEREKQLAATEAAYRKAIQTADKAFNAKEYSAAIISYKEALGIKPREKYPQERIVQARQAIAELEKQKDLIAEQQRIELERRTNLRTEYNRLIAEADKAFKNENYGLAKLRYTDADNLHLNEEYPLKQLAAIDAIINSAKYKAKMAEYNKNKTLAEKNLQQKNYAAAKVYYLKALSISVIDKEAIELQVAEIERLIEASHLAEIEKEYKDHIGKADKAFREKAYAVAKFYYKKALDIKVSDKYAGDRLKEVETLIGERQEKEAEL